MWLISAFTAILLTHLFEKIFLLRSERKRTSGAAVFNRLLSQHCIFKFYGAFYLMPTNDAEDRQTRTGVVSKRKRFDGAKLAHLGLASFVRGNVLCEGHHVTSVLTA